MRVGLRPYPLNYPEVSHAGILLVTLLCQALRHLKSFMHMKVLFSLAFRLAGIRFLQHPVPTEVLVVPCGRITNARGLALRGNKYM